MASRRLASDEWESARQQTSCRMRDLLELERSFVGGRNEGNTTAVHAAHGWLRGRQANRLPCRRQPPTKLDNLIQGISAAELRKRPAPEKWSVSEIIAHLADGEIVSGFRVRLILGSPGISMVAFDQDKWLVSGHYDKRDPQKSVEQFRVLREANLALLRSLRAGAVETLRSTFRARAGIDRTHGAHVCRARHQSPAANRKDFGAQVACDSVAGSLAVAAWTSMFSPEPVTPEPDGRQIRGACPLDCPDTCSWIVTVKNGEAVTLRGDPAHPYTRGSLCNKVERYLAYARSTDRLMYPMRRSGPKGSGEFTRISWDEALKRIASEFGDVIAKHGAEAIWPYAGSGNMGLIQGIYGAGERLWNVLGTSRGLVHVVHDRRGIRHRLYNRRQSDRNGPGDVPILEARCALGRERTVNASPSVATHPRGTEEWGADRLHRSDSDANRCGE